MFDILFIGLFVFYYIAQWSKRGNKQKQDQKMNMQDQYLNQHFCDHTVPDVQMSASAQDQNIILLWFMPTYIYLSMYARNSNRSMLVYDLYPLCITVCHYNWLLLFCAKTERVGVTLQLSDDYKLNSWYTLLHDMI